MRLTGTLIKPNRGPSFKKAHKRDTLILDLPNYASLSRYYIALIESELGPWCNLAPPMYGLHVTLIRGNGDHAPNSFGSMIGKQMSIMIDPTTLARTPWSGDNPAFWTIDVTSSEPRELRELLQIKPIFPYRPHITVARENLGFFMHAAEPVDPAFTAQQALKLIPLRGGNDGLRSELRDFISGVKVNPLATGTKLLNLVYNHISHPMKPWELTLINLFKRRSLT